MIQSVVFWAFLFGSAILYWILPRRIRYAAIALCSFAYIATLDWKSATALFFWSLAFFYLAPLAVNGKGWRRSVTPALMLAILSYLAFFKYIPPIINALRPTDVERNYIIPLGISYFSFKLIHYVIEVARGNMKDRSLQNFLLYIFFFPIFTAGPIERFDTFLASRDERPSMEAIVHGLSRIIYGLIKKFTIAGLILTPMLRGVTDASVLLERLDVLPVYKVWGFLYISFLLVYMDFSAYSDIAIGSSRLFGIKITENFNFPIIAPTVSNFWKRWHITLVNWVQAYIYLPVIGLTRNPYLAIFSTMSVMALWHAGSFHWLFWGWYHATGLVIFLTWSRYKRKRKIKFPENTPILRHWGIPLTTAWVVGGYAFTTTYQHASIYGAIRILAKLLALDLPA
jgi:alginate O-acetyltransferase complex protein AlgI